MPKISKTELPIPWWYWLCAALFVVLFCGAVALFLTTKDSNDRIVGATAGLVFFVIATCSILWPILRRNEAQGIQTEWVRTPEIHCEAMLFPCSRVKQYIIIFVSLFLGLGAGVMSFFADSMEHRVKGGIAAVFMAGVFVLSVKSILQGRLGILLMPEGIIWRELMRSPCFIPWDVVAQSGLFFKTERYGRQVLSFGLLVTDPAKVRTSNWTRQRLNESQQKTGWHFFFYAETILLPLALVARIVDFYHRHPEARQELGTSAALARVQSLDSEAAAPPQIR